MWVTILPFILVANVTIDDVNQNGRIYYYNVPRNFKEYEFTFEIVVNSSLITTVTNEVNEFRRLTVGELRCRPKRDNILTCYFTNARGYVAAVGKCAHDDSYRPEYELFRSNDTFEVEFNENGIENLIVSKRWTPKTEVEKIKAVLRQLDIGINVHHQQGITVKNKEEKEDSTCEIAQIRRDALQSTTDDTSTKNYQLAFASSNDASDNWQIQDVFRVKKVKQLNKCPPTYIFGDRFIGDCDSPDNRVITTASVRDIKISKNEFISSTTSEAVMYTPISPLRVVQELSVELKEIDFAYFPLRDISDPNVISMITYPDLKDIPPRTYSVTQQ